MKIFLFATLIYGVSSSKVFEIVAQTAAKKCYSCQDDCQNPKTENCQDADSKCYVTTVESTLKEARGCINSTAAATLCLDQTESCYICDTNLCNTGINVTDLGVEKCYVCIDQCDKPVAQHNCQEVLVQDIEGKPVKAACLSFSMERETGLEVSKGCVPDNDATRSSCSMMNFMIKGASCSICDEELCNGVDDGDGGGDNQTSVNQCYFCENNCETPVPIQNCSDVLGEGAVAKCISIQTSEGDQTSVIRKCVEEGDDIRNYCEKINQTGGKCSICEEELCNTGINVTDLGVEKCYVCIDQCDKPVAQHDCQEVLVQDIEGKPVKAACLSFSIERETGLEISKGCVPDNDATRSSCSIINFMIKGASCSICDEELCNGDDDNGGGNETSVDQCYFCENNCGTPVPIQNCSDVLGEGVIAKCISIQTSEGDQTSVIRKCVEDGDEIRNYCENIDKTGGECSICDENLCNVWKPEDGGKGGSKHVYPLFSILFTVIVFLYFV